MLQGLLARFEVLLPLAQRLVDHGPPAQQLASQCQPCVVLALQFSKGAFQAFGGQVLTALGVEVGEGLVPLCLEVDAGVGQVAPEDLQQVVLHLAGAQLVQTQCSGEHALKDAGIAGVLKAEHTEVLRAAQLAVSAAVHHVGEFAAAEAEHAAAMGGQMAG